MKDNIPAKESAYSYKRKKCKMLNSLYINSINYNYANHKKNLGEYMINKRTHKAFLRKHHLGKFAKCK